MADQDLLPRRPFAVLPPEPGGFEDALARGRRRRRRNTGGGVLASVVALALAVSLTGSGPDADAHLYVDQPEAGIAQDVSGPRPGAGDDSAEAIDVEDLEEPAQPDTSGSSGARTTRANRAAADGELEADEAAARRTANRKPTTAQRGRRIKAPKEYDDPQGYLSCRANSTLRTDGWCVTGSYRLTDVKNAHAALTLSVCLSPQMTSTTKLSFPGEQQADFVVRRSGETAVLWQWSHRALFGVGDTSDLVQPGGCRLYEVEWLGRGDNAGNHVPQGDYELTVTSLGNQLGGDDSATVPFQLD